MITIPNDHDHHHCHDPFIETTSGLLLLSSSLLNSAEEASAAAISRSHFSFCKKSSSLGRLRQRWWRWWQWYKNGATILSMLCNSWGLVAVRDFKCLPVGIRYKITWHQIWNMWFCRESKSWASLLILRERVLKPALYLLAFRLKFQPCSESWQSGFGSRQAI